MSRLSGREQAVWDKRNAGLTFKQIAKDLGLCPATVSFAYGKAYRKIEYGKERLKPTELEVYKRALELAVEEILTNKNEFYSTETYYTNGTLKAKLKQIYFIEQAKEALKKY